MSVYRGTGRGTGTTSFVTRLGANAGGSPDAIPSTERVIPYHVTIGFPPQSSEDSEMAMNGSGSIGAGSMNGAIGAARRQPVNIYGDGGNFWSEPPAEGGAMAATSSKYAANFSAQHGAAHPAPAAVAPPVARAPMTAPAPMRPAQTPRAFVPPARAGVRPGVVMEGAPRNPRRPVLIYPGYPFYPGFGGFGFGPFGLFGYPFFFDYDMGLNGEPCEPYWFAGCEGYYLGNDTGEGETSEIVDPNMEMQEQQPDQEIRNVWVAPPEAYGANEEDEIATEKFLTVLYLTDGSVYAVQDFWVDGGKLVYKTSYGAENSIDLAQLDLERTVKANTARGVTFTLKPKAETAPAPDAAPQPQTAPTTQPQSAPQSRPGATPQTQQP